MRVLMIFALSVGVAACVADTENPADSSGGGVTTTGAGAGSVGGDDASGGGGTGGGDAVGSTGSGAGDPCPPDMVCVTSFPFSHTSTTTGAASDQFDSYACGSQNESGPEVVYRVDVPSEGFLTLDLPASGMADGVDIDVHLLASLDANDCVDRGHYTVGELLPAGRYYVTADTWVSDSGVAADGAYTLELGLVTLQDLQDWGMTAEVAADALAVYDRAWTDGHVETTAYGVVDFGMHASKRRMWIIDMFNGSLRHHSYTTVGEMSDPDGDGWADVFSNTSESHQSSLGLMKAAEAYTGTYGKSVRLDGLELGYNDNVRPRDIVLHPWSGSAPAYVVANASTGAAPTWGCLGVDPAIVEDVRDFLSDGGLVLSHYPDGDWSQHSSFLP